MLVDSHCHLDRLDLDQLSLDQVIQDAHDRAVTHILCIGIDMNNADAVKDIAARYSHVFASVGVHPLDINTMTDKNTLLKAANHDKVVAIGETGLDYYYSSESAEIQKQSLIMHLQVAKELELPVVIHTRNAKQDTLDILRQYMCNKRCGVLHCFTEDIDMAKQAIEMGLYISFSGIVTFKNAKALQQVAREIPLERMLVETDSPYLTPTPFRGKANFPRYTREVAEFIADIRQEPLEVIAKATTDNFFRLFNKAARYEKSASKIT